jgi:hypothetical protein
VCLASAQDIPAKSGENHGILVTVQANNNASSANLQFVISVIVRANINGLAAAVGFGYMATLSNDRRSRARRLRAVPQRTRSRSLRRR